VAPLTEARFKSFADRVRHRVVPAVPVPFTAAGGLDEGGLRRYAEWMGRQAIGAVAVHAHTGRGLLLSPQDRETTTRIWRSSAPELPLVVGVGVPTGTELPGAVGPRTEAVIRATVGMAESAKAEGASALLVHPPATLRSLPDAEKRFVDLHDAVCQAGLPTIAFYLYEAAGGVSYSPPTVERLLDLPGVVGIKLATLDSVMRYQDLASVIRGHPETLLITGEDRFLGCSLMIGADAALVGIGAACTDAVRGVLDAWFQGDTAVFVKRTQAIDRFARATFRSPIEGYVQRMLWALVADGVLDGDPRDRFAPPLEPGDRDAVVQAVAALRRHS
jgi:4-hydroxy-tetrahydrodipicolinate synthase